MPFSTALLAHYPTLTLALVEYWLNIVLLGMTLLAGLEYGLRAHLFQDAMERELAHLVRGRIWVSVTLIVLIQLNYVLAPRFPLLERF